MFSNEDLRKTFKTGERILQVPNGIDSLHFRKGFDKYCDLTKDEKTQVMEFLENEIEKGGSLFNLIKKRVDQSEMFSDYYREGRKFRGCTYPVIIKTFAGIISVQLEQIKMKGDL